ncbi:hypothetical protein HMH01_05315 [Halovulum dunhuangense]|uniref:Sulfotransferase family protein n=1 Tax=Halovulum dunhuangense TaxID=1505036 RepID=A0A849L0R4_9RHOB|nr:hypothetical protein [Halovulum dunhuangense]NNU79857.1 hypothetical protein [Halovulum dunhuangense]
MARASRRLRSAMWLLYQYRKMRAFLAPAVAGRRVILHIGPHKTGTTTMQATLQRNRGLLAPYLYLVPRRDTPLRLLTILTRNTYRPRQLARNADAMTQAARRLARSCRHLPVTLITHEDLMGARPTLRNEHGLYAVAPDKLALIVDAFESEGARVEIVFYRRDFAEWLESLHRDIGKGGKPGGLGRRFGFPADWEPLLGAFRDRFGTRLCVLSFDADREAGRMGLGLLRLAGVPDATIEGIDWSPPRRVTSAATLAPRGLA